MTVGGGRGWNNRIIILFFFMYVEIFHNKLQKIKIRIELCHDMSVSLSIHNSQENKGKTEADAGAQSSPFYGRGAHFEDLPPQGCRGYFIPEKEDASGHLTLVPKVLSIIRELP